MAGFRVLMKGFWEFGMNCSGFAYICSLAQKQKQKRENEEGLRALNNSKERRKERIFGAGKRLVFFE
jgi:hypothetical protein